MIYAVTVYCYLGSKLGLIVRKCLVSLGVESSEARWSSSSKRISEVEGYSDWKCNGLLPLLMLAHSGPEEAFQQLLSLLLRYSVCGICWNELEGLALSSFPHWPALHLLYCYRLYWCGNAWKEQLSFMSVLLFLWSGIYSGSCTGTQVMNVSPSGLSLGGIPEVYSDCTPGGIRGKQGFNGEGLDISLGCHQVCPGASPPRLSRTGRDE